MNASLYSVMWDWWEEPTKHFMNAPETVQQQSKATLLLESTLVRISCVFKAISSTRGRVSIFNVSNTISSPLIRSHDDVLGDDLLGHLHERDFDCVFTLSVPKIVPLCLNRTSSRIGGSSQIGQIN